MSSRCRANSSVSLVRTTDARDRRGRDVALIFLTFEGKSVDAQKGSERRDVRYIQGGFPRDAHTALVWKRKIWSGRVPRQSPFPVQVPRDNLRKYKKPPGGNVTAGARKFTAADKLMSSDYGSGPQGKISVEGRRSRFQNLL